MLWELVATFSAGLGLMGLVLILRLFIKRIPKYSLPIAAGLGMLMFQIYNEYSWFEHTKARLPEGAVVVASSAVPVFYKPWSYWHAPTLYFIAVDAGNTQSTQIPHIKQTQMYFFQRLMSAHQVATLVDCEQGLQSDFVANGTPNWGYSPVTPAVIEAVCD